MSRADRRAQAAKAGAVTDPASLRTAITTTRLKGSPPQIVETARRVLLAYVDTALRQGTPFDRLVADLNMGLPAVTLARVQLDELPPDPRHACASGCAFCCILPGDDGGTMTGAEARTLHAALSPLAGTPDGRDWHPRACPALDPDSRMCRAYEARPAICRAYFSFDVAACELISEGTPASGTGAQGPHATYLVVQALTRAVLSGRARVPTYGLASLAAAAVAGKPLDTALADARHKPRELDDERKRSAKGIVRTR